MSQMNLAILLSKLGWGSGFRLPVSNDENRDLEKQLEKEQKYGLELRAQIGEEAKVRDNLKQHLGRVTTELGISRKLLESKKSTVETEANLLALDERQERNIAKEISLTEKNCFELESRNASMRREIELRRTQIDDNRYKMLGVDTASEPFKKALEQKEQDIDFILKLTNIDQKLVVDFEVKYQKYGETSAHVKLELDNTVKYTQTLDSQYERACAQYRRAHKERIQALDLWKRSLESLTKRDVEIKSMGQEYAHMLGLCKRADDVIERRQDVLKVRLANTESIENEVVRFDRDLSLIRDAITKIIEFRHRLTDEVVEERTTISNSCDSIKALRLRILAVTDETESMDNRMALAEAELSEVVERYKEAHSGVQTIETRMRQIEDMIIEEERKEDAFGRELERMRKYHFQKSNEAIALSRKSDDIEFEIKASNVMYKNLRELAKFDYIEVQKKRHLGYEMELRVLEVENRYNALAYPSLAEANNSTSMYFTSDTLARSREELDEVLKEKVLVMNQKGHLEDMIRRFTKEIEMDIHGRVRLEQDLTETRIKKSRVEKQLKATIKRLRHFEVEDVLIRLDCRKFVIADKEQKDKILSLEQQRLYQQMAATERHAEIAEHKLLLRMKRHMVLNEKSRRIFQRNEVLMEVKRRKKKYEILMASLASAEDREKQDFSEAFFILKNAQERESIKREGDLWDRRVKESEKEIVALQNTVALMVGSNKAFKDSLEPIKNTTEEGQQIKQLEHAQREAVVRKRKAEKLQRELAKHCSAKESEIFQLTQTIELLASMAEDKKYELNAVMVEIANQRAKIDRANKVAARLARDLGTQSDDDKSLIEAELQLKCAREKFGFALKTLDRALSIQPNMVSTVSEYLKQNPLLTDIAKRLLVHGKCTDSAAGSGTITPTTTNKHSTRGLHRKSQDIGTIYERHKKFSVSQTVSGSGSHSSGTPDHTGHRDVHHINTQELQTQLQELQREELTELGVGAD